MQEAAGVIRVTCGCAKVLGQIPSIKKGRASSKKKARQEALKLRMREQRNMTKKDRLSEELRLAEQVRV